MGTVYILIFFTNAAMPELVKIGMTEDDAASSRIGQLYATGVPLPFDLEYACKVDNAEEVEKALHTAFAPYRVNPKREFFRIDPEQAMVILRLFNQADVTEDIAKQPSGVDDTSEAAAQQARNRRPNLKFSEMKIPVGAKLELDSNPEIKVEIVSDNRVRFGAEECSLSAATRRALNIDYAIRPAPQWRYNTKLLSEIYERLRLRLRLGWIPLL